MKKRLLSLFCALSLLLTLLPTSVYAEEDRDEKTAAQTKDTEVAEPAPEEMKIVSLTADDLEDDEGLSGDDLLMGYLYALTLLIHNLFAQELRFLWPLLKPMTAERWQLYPLYWLLTVLWFLSRWGLIEQLFPGAIFLLGAIGL